MSPPFQYDSYVSPYTASIGDLLLRRGDIAAREAAAKGAAWGGAAQGIGNAVAGAIEQQTDPRRQLEVQQVDANKKAIVFGDTMNKITASLMTEQKDGSRVIDRGKLQQALSAANVPIAMQQAQFKALDDVDASIKGFTTARVDHAADMAHGALQAIQAGADPEATLATALALSKANGLITDEQAAPIVKAVAGGANIPQLLTQIRGLSDKYKDQNKPVVLPKDATLVTPTGTTIATGKAGAKTEAELAVDAANPNSPTHEESAKALQLLKTPAPAAAQPKEFLYQGKPVWGAFVPAKDGTGGEYFYNGEKVSGKIGVIPPASVQVTNLTQSAVANMPKWALDDSRPSGPDGNKLDPVLQRTPNAIFQDAMAFLENGTYPRVGMGSSPTANAVRAAVESKAGAIAAASGMDIPTLRAFYKSNAASLAQQQKSADAVQGFMATADKNAALLKDTLKKLPDTGSPIFNQPLRAFTKNVAGDKNLSQFATYLQSVQNEYARIISQPNLAGQLTDSARKEAETLVDGKSTVPQILGSLEALNNEGNNRLLSIGEQIQRIQQRMTVTGGPNQPAGPNQPNQAPKPAFTVGQTVQVGAKRVTITAIHPDGTFDGTEVK